jgi:hypothetical protein
MSRFEDSEKKDVDGGDLAGVIQGPMYSDGEKGPNGEKYGDGVLVIDGESKFSSW